MHQCRSNNTFREQKPERYSVAIHLQSGIKFLPSGDIHVGEYNLPTS